ncbi:hypothetical protein AVEN_216132-1 [Araneus ventricosus]|uniref:Uncharacterized protein n=1 Tax=Araneus ventricosus TaxID=182803 RepID=A0A4Y2UR85_ARAVE|nr:hypothetical protein AVEN_216132-1 [Araneus ventricosus]
MRLVTDLVLNVAPAAGRSVTFGFLSHVLMDRVTPYHPSCELKRIVVARGFVGWLERSGKMLVYALASKEASRRTETSVQFLRAVVDCVCFVGTVCLIEFSPARNLQRRKCIAKKLTVGTGRGSSLYTSVQSTVI